MIQWRIRTEYTFGRTFAPINRIVQRLQAIGCEAAAIVDRDGTWGHYNWAAACEAAGIQPMFGVELVVADEDDMETTMWFVARNAAGLREMYHFTSHAYRQKAKLRRGSVPRLYRQDVCNMSSNVLRFAGDITDGAFLDEVAAIADYSPSSRVMNTIKRKLAEQHGLLATWTSDNSYADEADAQIFELIVDRGVKPTPQHILSEFPQTDIIDLRDLLPDRFSLPTAPLIAADGDLEKLCRDGIAYRTQHNGLVWSDDYESRLMHELTMIRSKQFESYFIVVADMCLFAKQHMLVGPSRGSAAGSLVCYLTRITEIDPIPPGLFFERFIDVTRNDLPDIDLDFPDSKRHLVFEYMAERYGTNNVAHIGTVSKYKPRSALIQVCKKLGIPPTATGAVKVAMIERSEADSRANDCLRDTLETTTPGQQLVRAYPNVWLAAEIEGHASHTGVHAAGLLVCNEQIENYCTVTDAGIAQLEKGPAEALGLLKIDILGLRTLGIIEDAGVPIDWYALTFDDPATFDLFNSGRLCGIFQFEGNAMRQVAREIGNISTIDDVDAVTALARPGPFAGRVTQEYIERRAHNKSYKAIHPLVERFMAATYGLPLYQEQTMAIVREIGKFDWEQTSAVRKGISKRKGKEYFDQLWGGFLDGALSNGLSEAEATAIWEMINVMGSWQMNKAHTFSYAVLSYWTAYLKAHYPLEFAAASLRNAKDDDQALLLLREMVTEGLPYKPFDPLVARETWAAIDGVLTPGFAQLKGYGEVKARKTVEARDAGKLSQAMIDTAMKAESPFTELFPITKRYADVYANPAAYNIVGGIYKIADIPQPEVEMSCVFIAEIVKKNPRNYNEQVLINKRDGAVGTGPLDFLDMQLRDDTDIIFARINRYDYERIGKEILDHIPVGAHLLVRAKFLPGMRFAFVQRWKRLDVNTAPQEAA
jgi:DNA polymerase III alpha subunit